MKKRIALLVLFAVLAAGAMLLSAARGSVDIPLEEIFAILGGAHGTAHAQILWNIRLPRTIVAALVGINLALSGAILQAILRNPLADPHIIGISSGAGLAGIFIMLMMPGAAWLITPAAFGGAMLAALLIYILAWRDGIRPTRIILAGVAVSAFLGAGISAMMILYSDRVHSALMWMVGGLSARSWPHVDLLLPYTIVAGLLALMAAQRLNILQLGDDMARGIDLRPVEPTRERKSIGSETTFIHDLEGIPALYQALLAQNQDAFADVQKRHLHPHTLTIKLKYHDFSQITRSRSVSTPFTRENDAHYWIARLLHDIAPTKPVRLVGVTYSGLQEAVETRQAALPL